MTKTPDIFLGHILESIQLIERRIKGVSYEQFIDDVDIQDLIIRPLEIIGEAIRNLPKDFKEKHSHINWQDPAGMRVTAVSFLMIGFIWGYNKRESDVINFKKELYLQDRKAPQEENKLKLESNP